MNNAQQSYEQKRDAVVREYQAILSSGQSVRLQKPNSNLFRERTSTSARLNVRNFNGVVRIDPDTLTAEVEGMATFRTIVDETLKYGLLPAVVPELATITAGGVVSGGGIEASSFRFGLPHETVQSMDVLLPTGKVVTVTPKNEYRDLFYGIVNSYGTLGYILKLTIKLVKAKKYVRMERVQYDDMATLMAVIDDVSRTGQYEGKQVDFLEGMGFDKNDLYINFGYFSDEAPGGASNYRFMRPFYKSIAVKPTDYLTARDFIWRWDVDWYWCSKGFYMEKPVLRFLLGKWLLGSEGYWKLVKLDRRYKIEQRLRERAGKPPAESVIQDVQIPMEHTVEFWNSFTRDVPIMPVWFCPTRSKTLDLFPLGKLESNKTYINFGFWAHIPVKSTADPLYYNRVVEKLVAKLKGTKGLYAEVFYDKTEFWRMYNGAAYTKLKAKYDPESRLKDLYDKVVHGK